MASGPQEPTKLQALVDLHKHCLEAFDKRRSYEWKMSLALWGGIGISTGFLIKERTGVKVTAPRLEAAFIYAAILLVYAFLWAAPVAARQLKDLRMAEYYRTQIDRILAGEGELSKPPAAPSYLDGLRDFACLTKSLITAGILYLSWRFLTL